MGRELCAGTIWNQWMECRLAILFDFSSKILLRDTGQEPALHDTKLGAEVDPQSVPQNDGRLMRKSQLGGLEMP